MLGYSRCLTSALQTGTTGRVTGNDSLEAKGKSDRMKGNLKQAGENVKDAFKK